MGLLVSRFNQKLHSFVSRTRNAQVLAIDTDTQSDLCIPSLELLPHLLHGITLESAKLAKKMLV